MSRMLQAVTLIVLVVGAAVYGAQSADRAAAQSVGTVAPCTWSPDFVWHGSADSMMFGARMNTIGDFNSDGYDELWVSELGFSKPLSRCYVYSGLDQTLLFSIESETGGGFFLSAAGADLNSDGYSDLIFGDPRFGAGRVYIFYGSSGPFSVSRSAADADAFINGTVMEFGSGIAAVGDINGDAHDDFAVGAPESSVNGRGHVYVFSGLTLDTIYSLKGEAYGDGFGYFLADPGDINADGHSDLMVAAPASTGSGMGLAYVYSAPDGDLLYRLAGETYNDWFSWWGPNGAGDLNLDGYDDVIVGAGNDGAGGAGAGRAYVFLGGPGPFPQSISAADADYVVTGEALSHFGSGVTGIPDVNGDGHPDFAVGANSYYQLYRAGYVCVLSGADGSELFRIDGEAGEDFGLACESWEVGGSGAVQLQLLVGAGCQTEINRGTGEGRGHVYAYAFVDTDADHILDDCDNCPGLANDDQANADADLLGDVCDNCPDVANDDQADSDGDTFGDVCDLCPAHATLDNETVMTGDANNNDTVNSSDIIYLVNYVFKSGPEPLPIRAAGNCTAGDTVINSADVIYLVNYVFKSGPQPVDCCTLPLPRTRTSVRAIAASSAGEGLVRLTPRAEQAGAVEVIVSCLSNERLAALDIPLRFGAPGDAITLEGVEWSNAVAGWDLTHAQIDNENKTVILGLISELVNVRPGADLKVSASGGTQIAELVFRVGAGYEPTFIPFTTELPGHELSFLYNEMIEGMLTVRSVTPEFEVDMSFKNSVVPDAYALSESFPNPFNPTTSFTLSLPVATDYSLRIFNVAGQLVKSYQGHAEAGVHTITWAGLNDQGSQVASGVYFLKAQANAFEATRKMLMIK